MKLSHKIAYILSGIILAIAGGVVYAANVSVPQATQVGQIPMGLSTGNYAAGNLVAGTNIVINTTTPGRITISATASGSSATTTINGVLGPSFLFQSANPSLVVSSSTGIITLTVATSAVQSLITGTAPISVLNGVVSCPTCVTNVTGSGNIASSGGTTPNITLTGIIPALNGGTGTTTLADLTVGTNLLITGGQKVLIGTNTVISIGPAVVTTNNLVAGTNITINTSTPGQVIINSSVGATTTINGLIGPTFTLTSGTPITGLNLNITNSGSTVTFSPQFQSGFGIPLVASTTQWSNLYNNLYTRLNVTTSSNSSVFTISTSSPGNLNINFPNNLATTNTLVAGSNITISTSTPGQIVINSTASGSGTLSGGIPGFVGVWASSTALTVGTLRDNGTVSGVNATSSTVSFNVQGSGVLNPFNISSSSGTSLLKVTPIGNVQIATLTPNTLVGTDGQRNLISQAIVGGANVTVTTSTPGLIVVSSTGGTGGSGNSAWTIGNGTIYNATSTDFVGVGTPNPTRTLSVTSSSGNIADFNGNGVARVSINDIAADNSGFNILMNGSAKWTAAAYKPSGTNYSFTFYNEQLNSDGLFINGDTNNVGISTNTPSARLYVKGSGLTTGRALAVSDNNNVEKFTILDNGSVGIGTTTPVANLSVVNTGNQAAIDLMDYATGGSPANSWWRFYADKAGGGGGNTTLGLYDVTNNAVRFGIDNNGNVGISTTTPNARLNVTGSATVDPFNITSTTGVSLLKVTSNGNLNVATLTPNTLVGVDAGKNLISQAIVAGTNVTIDTSTPKLMVINSTGGGSGTVSGGIPGFVTTWASSTSLTTGILKDNGTVAGVNATSSTVSFNVQGGGGITKVLDVTSSTGTSLFTVLPNGKVGIKNNNPTSDLYIRSQGNGSAAVQLDASNALAEADYLISQGNAIQSFYGVLSSLPQMGGTYQDTFIGANNHNILFSTDNLSTATLLLGSNFRAGINTTTPGATLSVRPVGTDTPLIISSSSGSSLFSISRVGNVNVATLTPFALVGVDSGKNLVNQALVAGSNVTITTSTPGQIIIASTASGGSSKQLPSFIVSASGGTYTTIQAALDACGVVGGGTIYLTDQTYAQGGTGLRFKGSNCNIYGNTASTTITFTGATTYFKSNTPSSVYSNNGIHNVVITGDANANSVAIDASDMSHGVYENIIIDSVATGLVLNDTQNTTFYNDFANWQITTLSKFGINASSTNAVNDNIFTNFFTGCSSAGCVGAYFNNGNNNKMYGFRAEPSNINTTGIRLTDVSGKDGLFDNQFYGSYIEANGTGISISGTNGSNGGITRNQFYGGIIDANTTDINASSTTGYLQTFMGVDKNFGNPLTSLQGPVGVNNLSAAAMLDVVDPTFGNLALSVSNNTNFGENAVNLVNFKLLNGSDTANLLNLKNAGTGNTIISTSTTNSFQLTAANAVGFNSSTPGAILAIQGTTSAPTVYPFVVASSSRANLFNVGPSGNIGIGTSTPVGKLGVNGTVFLPGITVTTGGTMLCRLPGGQVIDANSTTCLSSSQFLKHDITDITDAEAEEIMKLRPRQYAYNDSGEERYGFISEEVFAIDPKLVMYAQTEFTQDGHTFKAGDPLGVDYERYVALLTRYVQLHTSETPVKKNDIFFYFFGSTLALYIIYNEVQKRKQRGVRLNGSL